MRGSCQVGTCTPFVTAMIGAASSTSAHIARDVSPWSSETAFARRASRSPATVMLNGSPPIWRSSQSTSSQPAPSRRSSASEWTSLPAGTGVWVVKTMRSRAARQAASKLAPASIRSAISSMPANTACPSLKW